jgi:hypothetical protein
MVISLLTSCLYPNLSASCPLGQVWLAGVSSLKLMLMTSFSVPAVEITGQKCPNNVLVLQFMVMISQYFVITLTYYNVCCISSSAQSLLVRSRRYRYIKLTCYRGWNNYDVHVGLMSRLIWHADSQIALDRQNVFFSTNLWTIAKKSLGIFYGRWK